MSGDVAGCPNEREKQKGKDGGHCGEAKGKGKTTATADETTAASGTVGANPSSTTIDHNSVPVVGSQRKGIRASVGADPNKPPCRKAKVARRERREAKKKEKSSQSSDDPKDCSSASSGLGLQRPNMDATCSPKEVASEPPLHSVLAGSADGRKPLEAFLDPHTPAQEKEAGGGTHTLAMTLVQSSPPSPEFKATFSESYTLYKKYQMAIHNDEEGDCTEKQFRRFLCDSPLIHAKGPPGWPCGYGSYHHHYRVDGKLVMVGVVDILPTCLSSVYVFYDPDFMFLSLGVYSALREIELTRKMHAGNPDFIHYCMGYYVHSCQKMRYKGNYSPSLLLCPEMYVFVPIEACRPKLDLSKYSRLNESAVELEGIDSYIDKVLVLFSRQAMPYGIFKQLVGTDFEAKVREYAGFVGPRVAQSMLLFLSF